MTIRSFNDLDAWKVSMDLAEECFRVTAKFPRSEQYGMTSQIRRAATSVPANIAEGYGREQTGAFVQFLRVAQGSTRELETHFLLAQRVGYLTADAAAGPLDRCERVSKMLRALIGSLQSRSGGSE